MLTLESRDWSLEYTSPYVDMIVAAPGHVDDLFSLWKQLARSNEGRSLQLGNDLTAVFERGEGLSGSLPMDSAMDLLRRYIPARKHGAVGVFPHRRDVVKVSGELVKSMLRERHDALGEVAIHSGILHLPRDWVIDILSMDHSNCEEIQAQVARLMSNELANTTQSIGGVLMEVEDMEELYPDPKDILSVWQTGSAQSVYAVRKLAFLTQDPIRMHMDEKKCMWQTAWQQMVEYRRQDPGKTKRLRMKEELLPGDLFCMSAYFVDETIKTCTTWLYDVVGHYSSYRALLIEQDAQIAWDIQHQLGMVSMQLDTIGI